MGDQYGSLKRGTGNLARQTNKKENIHGGVSLLCDYGDAIHSSYKQIHLLYVEFAAPLNLLKIRYIGTPHKAFWRLLIFKQRIIKI